MFDPSTYEAVVTRFARFREQYPDYRWYSWISREFTNEKQWVVIGELYRTEADQKSFVTGLGFEPARDEYSLAKAETSALGRCLYAAGFAGKPLGAVDVVLGLAVAEVQANHVHPCAQQVFQHHRVDARNRDVGADPVNDQGAQGEQQAALQILGAPERAEIEICRQLFGC